MNANEIFTKLQNEVKGGRFYHFTFTSNPETINKAPLVKVTTIYARTKVSYTARRDYKAPEEKAPAKNPRPAKTETIVTYTIPNCVKHLTKVEKASGLVVSETDNVMLYMRKGTKGKSYYMLDGKVIPTETAKAMLAPKNGTYTETYIRTPHLENILEIK